jgi:8-oxo-dGTP pyrophosphatase MutT (NUDIX family)
MKKAFWRGLFWLTWPLIAFYSPLRTRSRMLVVHGDEFLVVKPYFGSGDWQLPGGGIKFLESGLQAAVRETKEEAGISIDPESVWPLMALRTYHENGLLKRYMVFATAVASKHASRIRDYEIIDKAWLPLTGPYENCAPHVVYAARHYRSARKQG